MPDAGIKLNEALYTAVANDATLQSALGGASGDRKFYPGKAHSRAGYPYIVYWQVSNAPWSVLGTQGLAKKKREAFVYQFDIWTSGRSARKSMDIYSALTGLLDEASFAVAGHKLIRSERIFDWGPTWEDEAELWHQVVRYRFLLEPTS